MIGTILTLVAPLITSLIPKIEAHFKDKQKKDGENPKMDTLMSVLSVYLNSLMQNGVVEKTPLDKLSPELRGAAEQILAEMKAKGVVEQPTQAVLPSGTQYVGVNFQDMIILRQVK